MRRLRAARMTLLAISLGVGLTACSGQLQGTDNANFPVGDGAVVHVAVADRSAPIDLSGPSLDDAAVTVDIADLRGRVVVLNVWGSWCNPCIAEAPVLKEASDNVDAAFVGMSFRESSFDAARALQRKFDITYPTIADRGAGVLALGRYAPRSPPSTYILDTQGRVAAVITGEISSAATLEGLVEDVAAEDG